MSDTNEEPSIVRRASHVAAPEGETVPPPAPPRPPLPGAAREAGGAAPRPSAALTARRTWVMPAVAGVLGVLLGAVLGSIITASVIAARQQFAAEAAVDSAEAAKRDFFAVAAKRCGLTGVVEIADGGRTMIVDGEGEDAGSGRVSLGDLECIIDAVDTPASVKELMYSTRSLDGRQSGDWEGVSASWGYHPDDGLDIIFVIAD